MKTYLLNWSPKHFNWDSYSEDCRKSRILEKFTRHWSCGNRKDIKKGDKFYFIRLGKYPKGIIGSGTITKDTYREKRENRIMISFDILLDYNYEGILDIEKLKQNIPNMNWFAEASGTLINDDIADKLKILWKEFNEKVEFKNIEEYDLDSKYHEGSVKTIKVNIYERNIKARTACIRHYGSECRICGFSFRKKYGDYGKDFIHVHHLKKLSKIKKKYRIDPVKDLIPVCPNCHAMIHLRKDPIKPEELKQIISLNKKT